MIICVNTFIFVISSVITTARKIPYGQNLILLFIDGFGVELLDKTDLGFYQLIENGVSTEYLKPVFPTQDYPNWMSLFTGLYVENHGFTSDYVWNKNKNATFVKGEIVGGAADDNQWWFEHPAPAWYTTGKSNVDVHCYWIAGCDKPYIDTIIDVPPDRKFNHSFPEQTEALPTYFPEMIEKIVKYQSYRQQFFLLRYGGLRNALELYGADSDEVKQSLMTIDLYLFDLQQKLRDANLLDSTNLMVLSAFGMHKVDTEQQQFLIEECLADYSRIQNTANFNAFSMIYTRPDELDEVYFELKVCEQWTPMGDYDEEEHALVSVYRSTELPERFHWRHSRFMSEIVLLSRPGIIISTRELPSITSDHLTTVDVRQTAGWDNDDPSMRGIFIAQGPAFKNGYKAQAIGVVDIYQIILNIFGIEPHHPHNGTWSLVEDFLKNGWETRSSGGKSSEPSSSMSHLINHTTTLPIILLICVIMKQILK